MRRKDALREQARALSFDSGNHGFGRAMDIGLNQIAPSDVQIEDLVATFYARNRKDGELGPIFERVIGSDWGPHLKTMCDFWSSVMNTTGRYKGKPIPAHVKLTGIEPRHFERWLSLFGVTAREMFEPALAELFILRARRIAESLKLGFAFHAEHPEIWGGIPRNVPS